MWINKISHYIIYTCLVNNKIIKMALAGENHNSNQSYNQIDNLYASQRIEK